MQATETADACTILGGLYHEAEVDRNTLVALSGLTTSSLLRFFALVELGLDTDWAMVDLSGNRKFLYPDCIIVHVTDATGMHLPRRLHRI
jgi:hypothetical protein